MPVLLLLVAVALLLVMDGGDESTSFSLLGFPPPEISTVLSK